MLIRAQNYGNNWVCLRRMSVKESIWLNLCSFWLGSVWISSILLTCLCIPIHWLHGTAFKPHTFFPGIPTEIKIFMVVIRIISCNACIIMRFLCVFSLSPSLTGIVSMKNRGCSTPKRTHIKWILTFFPQSFYFGSQWVYSFSHFSMVLSSTRCVAGWIKYQKIHFNSLFRGKIKQKQKNHLRHYQSSFLYENLHVFVWFAIKMYRNGNTVNGHLNGVLSTVIKTTFSSEITHTLEYMCS